MKLKLIRYATLKVARLAIERIVAESLETMRLRTV